MTPLADILRSMEAWRAHVGPIAEEHARQQAAVEARALAVLREAGGSHDAARKVALFSLGGWARRYPDAPYDIGERAALFIAEWCAARAVFPDDDQMHEALAADVPRPQNRHERRRARSRKWRG